MDSNPRPTGYADGEMALRWQYGQRKSASAPATGCEPEGGGNFRTGAPVGSPATNPAACSVVKAVS